ncbi:MAG: hypothetical protein IT380_03100 [Myxococcales bacterium]|nr:hypothetical protein [Myxococcales bacterium]
MANHLWSAGAFSEPVDEELHEFSAGDILLVARDPQVTTDGRVIVSDFFVSGAAVSGTSPWVARNVSLAVLPQPGGGGGRCCGHQYVGQQTYPSIDDLPSEDCVPTPVAMCWGSVMVLGPTETQGPGLERTQAGMPSIPMKLFGPTGEEHGLEFFPAFGGIGSSSCTFTKQDCTMGAIPGSLPGQWEAEVPRSGSPCAPSSPVSGRVVPERCTFAGVSMALEPGGLGVSRPAGGAAPLAECDGRCPGCGEPAAMWNTDVVPKQCWIAQTSGQDDVCGLDTTAKLDAFQNQIRDFEVSQTAGSCMDLSDPTARCGSCRTVSAARDAFRSAGLEICSRCSDPLSSGTMTNCRRYPHWIGTPIDQVVDLRPGYMHIEKWVCENGNCVEVLDTGIKSGACTTPQCGQSGASPVMPSGSPRPGRMQSVDDQHLNSATMDSDDTGESVADEPKDLVHSANQTTQGDPVNVVDGSLVISQTDLSFPGPHRALTFTRFYSSQTSTRGALGSNWVHNWETRVIPMSKANMPDWVDPYCAGTPIETTCVMLVAGESSRLFYLDQATGVFLPQAGSMATVKRIGTGWVVRQPDGHKLFFNHRGYLVADKDRFGSGFRLKTSRRIKPTQAGGSARAGDAREDGA